MKKAIATIILAMLAQGVIAWRTVAVHQESIENNKKSISRNETSILGLSNKINDIHWFLIESKGVKINKGKQNGKRN